MPGRGREDYYLAMFCQHLVHLGFDSKTIRCYRSDVAGFIRWYLESFQEVFSPEAVTEQHLGAYYQWLLGDGKRPATVRRKLTSVRAFLSWALARGLLVRLPRSPRSGPTRRRPAQVLTVEEQEILLATLEAHAPPRDLALVLILLDTGVSLSELLQITGQDVAHLEGGAIVLTVRGRKGVRHVRLSERAARALRRYLADAPVRAGEKVFRGRKGPLGPRAVQQLMARYACAAGLAGKVSAAILRRTFVVMALARGETLTELASRLGIAKRSLRSLLEGREEWR